MKQWILGLGLIGVCNTVSYGQAHVCGTTLDDQDLMVERLERNRALQAELLARIQGRDASNQTIHIPIQFHFIANAQGQGRADIEGMMANMCQINEDYAPINVRFYLEDLPIDINNSLMYENNDRSLVNYLMYMYRDPYAVNIYVGNSINNMGGFGTTLGYYAGFYDVIYAIRSQLQYGNKTLSHELGHLFTLPHPFFGWDGQDPYEVITLNGGQTPVDIGGRLVENVVRGASPDENCQVAGDRFCDTKPDYNVGIYSNTCNFFNSIYYNQNGPLYDPTGAQLDANNSSDNTLIMSYFGDNCTSRFSPDQNQAILTDIAARGYDRFTPPTTATVSDKPVQIYPNASSAPLDYGTVEFTWNPAPGATHYVVVVQRMLNGSPIETTYKRVEDTTRAYVTLQPNRQYRWYIRPFNLNDLCTASFNSDIVNFSTGNNASPLSVEAMDPVDRIVLMPNPVQRGQEAALQIEASQSAAVRVSMFNVLGESILNAVKTEITPGMNLLQLPTQGLNPGMYFIAIDSPHGRRTEKLLIHE